MQPALSIIVLLVGVGVAWVYLRQAPQRSTPGVIGGDRPWRRVGAAICGLLAVMFVLGINVMTPAWRPVGYLLYWGIMLVLVIWLCALAVKDVLYTQSVLSRWRAGRVKLDGTPITNEPPSEKLPS